MLAELRLVKLLAEVLLIQLARFEGYSLFLIALDVELIIHNIPPDILFVITIE